MRNRSVDSSTITAGVNLPAAGGAGEAIHSTSTMIPNVAQIPALQDELTLRWHVEALEAWRPPSDAWTMLVVRQHLANFELWHTEDAARTPDATDGDLARVKRRIDETNQRRNDLSEQIDLTLLEELAKQGLPAPAAPLNSESPGLMIDRLSILAL